MVFVCFNIHISIILRYVKSISKKINPSIFEFTSSNNKLRSVIFTYLNNKMKSGNNDFY